jgi:hypothetical protein
MYVVCSDTRVFLFLLFADLRRRFRARSKKAIFESEEMRRSNLSQNIPGRLNLSHEHSESGPDSRQE